MGGKSLFQVGEDVEFWRVLAHLSILVVFLLVFESALHILEHQLARYDKYHHMLQKVYRELMILGLISLILKILKEVTSIDAYSKPVTAFQVAELIIFGLAIALILQSTCIFLLQRQHGRHTDEAELISTQSLVARLKNSNNGISRESSTRSSKKVVEHRLLRHLFLRRFGLPQLFPFSKYIRQAQANQISLMIEVQPSMWFLLLAIAWGICGLAKILKGYELVKLLVICAWLLVLLHFLVLVYFRWCVQHILVTAGYTKDGEVLVATVTALAEDELAAWENESADDALRCMNRVHGYLEENQEKEAQPGIFKGDMGLQLISSWYRKENSKLDGAVQLESPDIDIRFFSRDAWRVVVAFLMSLNGFFIALFVQCSLYNLDEIYRELGLIAAILVPLPMMLNTIVLQQLIFRDFVLICSILLLDSSTLGEVVSHFSEIIELRSGFATSLLQSLNENGTTIDDLEKVVQSHDLNKTGFIDIDNLRKVLGSFGFIMPRFRFNSLTKLLVEMNGKLVNYSQLLHLLVLVQGQDDHQQSESRRQKPETIHESSSEPKKKKNICSQTMLKSAGM